MYLSALKVFSSAGLRVRLTGWFIFIFGLTLVAFSALLYHRLVFNHQTEFDAFLYNYAIDLKYSLDIDRLGDVTVRPEILADHQKVFPFAPGETFLQVSDDAGRVLAHSGNSKPRPPVLRPESLVRTRHQKVWFETKAGSEFGSNLDPEYRRIILAFDREGRAPHERKKEFILQVAVPTKILRSEKERLRVFFAGCIPFALLIAAGGGLFLSKRALAPITAIVDKTREIQAHQLSERVPVPTSRDEVSELALTLNQLLNRLEQAFRAQEAFIANASHQLKTPLSILRGEIDWMAKKPRREDPEMAQLLSSASQEVDHLSKTVEDLLVLARTEAGPQSLTVDRFRFDEKLLEALGRLERLADRKKIQLSVDLSPFAAGDPSGHSFEMRGDGHLMRGLIENLVENAIKYGPAGSTIRLELAEGKEDLKFTVQDSGPGFPSADADRIFTRFYRAAGNSEPGSGLGLAIVKRISDLHRGEVRAENTTPYGARFTAVLPKSL